MTGTRLFLAQRISALIMVPLVFAHLGVMIYAVQGGLSAAEILSRTQGSIYWLLFYGLFVFAASIHAAIGIRVLMAEYIGLKGRVLDLVVLAIGSGFLYLGLRAVIAVTGS